MSRTIVLQSYRAVSSGWQAECTRSVREWARQREYDYLTASDSELFGSTPTKLGAKLRAVSLATAVDAARLYWMREILAKSSVGRVVWVDDDVLMLGEGPAVPEGVEVIFAREQWISRDYRGRLARTGAVSNCLMAVENTSSFLDFYIWAIDLIASRKAIRKTSLGPDFLTHLAKQVPFTVIASVPTLSPIVLSEVAQGSFELLASISHGGLNHLR